MVDGPCRTYRRPAAAAYDGGGSELAAVAALRHALLRGCQRPRIRAWRPRRSSVPMSRRTSGRRIMPRADSPVVVARRHVIEFEHRVERQRELLERLQRGKNSSMIAEARKVLG